MEEGGGGSYEHYGSYESNRDTVEFSWKNRFRVYKTISTVKMLMSNNRKEVLINFCRKVGYFLPERDNGRLQSPLSGCQECINTVLIEIFSGETVNALRDLSGTDGSAN